MLSKNVKYDGGSTATLRRKPKKIEELKLIDDVERVSGRRAARTGLSLEKVGRRSTELDLREAVAVHLARVEEEFAQPATSAAAAGHPRRVRPHGRAVGEQIIVAIEVMTMTEQYYTPASWTSSRRARRARRRGMAQAQQDWAGLRGGGRGADGGPTPRTATAAPRRPRQALIARSRALTRRSRPR